MSEASVENRACPQRLSLRWRAGGSQNKMPRQQAARYFILGYLEVLTLEEVFLRGCSQD